MAYERVKPTYSVRVPLWCITVFIEMTVLLDVKSCDLVDLEVYYTLWK